MPDVTRRRRSASPRVRQRDGRYWRRFRRGRLLDGKVSARGPQRLARVGWQGGRIRTSEYGTKSTSALDAWPRPFITSRSVRHQQYSRTGQRRTAKHSHSRRHPRRIRRLLVRACDPNTEGAARHQRAEPRPQEGGPIWTFCGKTPVLTPPSIVEARGGPGLHSCQDRTSAFVARRRSYTGRIPRTSRPCSPATSVDEHQRRTVLHGSTFRIGTSHRGAAAGKNGTVGPRAATASSLSSAWRSRHNRFSPTSTPDASLDRSQAGGYRNALVERDATHHGTPRLPQGRRRPQGQVARIGRDVRKVL